MAKSIDKGLYKVMPNMGISTYQSHCGAQIFDASGCDRIRQDVLHRQHGSAASRTPAEGRTKTLRAEIHDVFADEIVHEGMQLIG